MAESVEFEITAKVDDALKSVQSLEKSATSSVDSISKAFDSLKVVAGAALAFLGGKAIVNFFGEAIDSANEADKAINQLEISLKSLGEFTPQIVEEFAEFAQALQDNSKFSDESALELLALAKQMGVTNDEAEKLVQASADLASVTGDSLEGAFSELSKTLKGSSGRLANTIPEVKGLTEAQLKAGAAIDLVSDRLKGASSGSLKTFQGSMVQLQNSTNDFKEEVGKLITQNPVLISAVTEGTKALRALSIGILSGDDGFTSLITTTIKFAADVIPIVVKGMAYVVEAFEFFGLAIASSIRVFADLKEVLIEIPHLIFGAVTKPVELAANVLGELAERVSSFIDTISNIEGAEAIFGKLGVNLKDLKEGLDSAAKSLGDFRIEDKVYEENQKDIEALRKTALDFGDSVDDSLGKAGRGLFDFADKAEKVAKRIEDSDSDVAKAAAKAAVQQEVLGQAAIKASVDAATAKAAASKAEEKALEDYKKRLEKAETANKAALDKQIASQQKLADESSKFLDRIFAKQTNNLVAIDAERQRDLGLLRGYLEAGVISYEEAEAAKEAIRSDFEAKRVEAIKKENEKAASLVTDFIGGGLEKLAQAGVSFLTETFLPGFGEAAGQVFAFLAQDTEKFAAGLEQLFSVQFIDNISKNLVLLLQKLPDLIANVITFLGQNADKIIEPLITAIIASGPKVALALGKLVLDPKFIESVALAIANGVANGLKDLGGQFSAAFKKGVSDTKTEIGTFFKETITAGFTNAAAKIRDKFGDIFVDGFKDAAHNISEVFSGIFEDIGNAFKDLFKIEVGGGGGVLGKVGKALGFAKGGVVPEGFPNDTFPASLTSGELVIPRDLVRSLEGMISRDERGGRNSDAGQLQLALLSKIATLLAQPQQVTTTAEVNGRELANIILNLSRNNARLAV